MNNPLGFSFNSKLIPEPQFKPLNEVIFRVKKLLPGYVFDTTYLEDNPYTFAEVKTLLDGITVGGHRLSDEQQVLNQAYSWQELLKRALQGSFSLDKKTFCELNAIVANQEALVWGQFRTGKVSIAGTDYLPPAAEQLDELFNQGIAYLKTMSNPLTCGLLFFLFGALRQFFYDGNKRTSRLIMNGILLSHGIDAITIPAKFKQAFNEKMIRFYDHQQADEMLEFLLTCYQLAK